MVKNRKTSIRASREDRIIGGVIAVLVTAITLSILYPLWFVIIASVSDPLALNRGEVLLWPVDFTLMGYEEILGNSKLWTGYGNTLIYFFAGTAINIALTICAAYPLSRQELDGRNLFVTMITVTMFVGGGTIPSYLINKSLGIVNTRWVMLLPGAMSAWNFIVMRTYFQNSIPGELYESASIDGCSHFKYMGSILLPLSKPIIAVMILYYGIGHWNDYYTALIYLRKDGLQPLQIVLRDVLIKNIQLDATADLEDFTVGNTQKAELIKYCMIVVSSFPMMVLYPFLQKYFAKGAMVGSIKG